MGNSIDVIEAVLRVTSTPVHFNADPMVPPLAFNDEVNTLLNQGI